MKRLYTDTEIHLLFYLTSEHKLKSPNLLLVITNIVQSKHNLIFDRIATIINLNKIQNIQLDIHH